MSQSRHDVSAEDIDRSNNINVRRKDKFLWMFLTIVVMVLLAGWQTISKMAVKAFMFPSANLTT